MNDGRYRWTCRQFLSTEECHASLCLCLRVSCFPAVCCVNDVLIIDLTAAEASCWVCVFIVILNWSSDVYCVCVCVAFCSSTTIHWSSAGWRVIYRLGRWMGGGWAIELMISPLRNLCSRGQTTHTVAPHPVYHCRYPLSSSTQTLLLPPNFKFIFPPKFTFVFLLMLQPAIKMVPFKICVKTFVLFAFNMGPCSVWLAQLMFELLTS